MKWGIVPVSAYDFAIEGRETTGELLRTAKVHKRLSSAHILCVDGRSYELVGPFNRAAGVRGCIPARILDAFVNGVPRNWRQVILGWGEEEINAPHRCEAESPVKFPDFRPQPCSADSDSQKMRPGQQRRQYSRVVLPIKKRRSVTSTYGIVPVCPSPLPLKEVAIVVERLPAAMVTETVNGASAVGPSTPHLALSDEKKCRLSAPTKVSLSGKAKQKVPKKHGANVGTSLRRRSCPATLARARDVSGERSNGVWTRSRTASAQRILRSAKKGMQATPDVNGKIQKALTPKMHFRKQSISGSKSKKIASRNRGHVIKFPGVKRVLSSPRNYRKNCSGQGHKKETKPKDKPESRSSRKSSRGEQTHSGKMKGCQECKSSTSIQTRSHCYPTCKYSEVHAEVMSPSILPDKSKSSMNSSLRSLVAMEKTCIQLRSNKRDILASRQPATTASLKECPSAITNKRYPVRSGKKTRNTELSSAKRKFSDLISLSGCQDEPAKKDFLPREDECGLDGSEFVQRRSGRFYQRKNGVCENKFGAKPLNILPAKRKSSISDVRRTVNDEQQTGTPHSHCTSRESTFAKQKKATASLRKSSFSIKQKRPSRTTNDTGSAQAIPVKGKSHRRISSGSRKSPARKSSFHSEVQGKHQYSLRIDGLAVLERATKSSSVLVAKHKFSLDSSRSTASGKQQAVASRKSQTLSRKMVTKLEKAAENKIQHSSSTVRTLRSLSNEFNSNRSGSLSHKGKPKLNDRSPGYGKEVPDKRIHSLNTRRTALKNSAATASPNTSKKNFGNVREEKVGSRAHHKICTLSGSGQRKSNSLSTRGNNAQGQRETAKRKCSVATSSESSPRKKASTHTPESKKLSMVTSLTRSSRSTADKQGSRKIPIGQEKVCSISKGESSAVPLSAIPIVQEKVCSISQGESSAVPFSAILAKNAANGGIAKADDENHSNTTGSKISQKEQAPLEVSKNNSNGNSLGQPSTSGANTFGSVLQTAQADNSDTSGELEKIFCEQADPFIKPLPFKQGLSLGSRSQTRKPGANESTEAFLAITAQKGTLKREAQIQTLADALAAKEAYDDIYNSQDLRGNIPDELCTSENWDDRSEIDIQVSRMPTPVLNSPHLSPERSQYSFSSESSLSESPIALRAPSEAAAIMRSLRVQPYVTTFKPITPKPKYMNKKQNVNKVLQGLRNLEAEMEKNRLKENCKDSSEEMEEDTESSPDEKSFFH